MELTASGKAVAYLATYQGAAEIWTATKKAAAGLTVSGVAAVWPRQEHWTSELPWKAGQGPLRPG